MKSIRNRLTVALISTGALLLIALLAAIYGGARTLLREQFDDGLRARLQAIVSLLHWHPGRVELDYKGEFMPEFERRDGGFFFQVWTQEEDRPLERSHSLGGADLMRFGGTLDAPELRDLALPDGRQGRAIGVLVRRHSEQASEIPELTRAPPGPGADIVVAGDTTALHARLNRLATGVAVGGALGLLSLAGLVRHTLRRGLAPLNTLSEQATRMGPASLAERFPEIGLPPELEPIAIRLNDLLTRLEKTFAQERRFSANVAHELRTPIAELMTLAEVGLRLASKDPEHASFFQDATEIARRMDATVSCLLMLARCEDGRQPVERSGVNLRVLVESLGREAQSRATEKNLSFTCHGADREIWTDPALFKRLCDILLENAWNYTQSKGAISITATDSELHFSNGPVLLGAADIAHLFERFWRKDTSRSDVQHSGLGLALAAELARVLGMKLVPELDASRTFHMRVVF